MYLIILYLCTRLRRPLQVINRWLSVRLEIIGALVIFATALFATVVFPRNAGLAGLVRNPQL